MTNKITPITMPKWGLTMTEGKVLGWLKKEGEAFRAGEELLEIETTKITNVMEASEGGKLRRIVAAPGATLAIGALLAVAAPDDVPDSAIEAFIAGFVTPEPAAEEAEEAGAIAPHDINAGGRRLRVLDLGGGPPTPVVLVHGFGADLNTWMFTQPPLAESRRAIALDLPGHGGSTKEVGSGDAEALTAALRDAVATLGLDRVHLVGHSLGGALALSLVQQDPERVASLTLIASAGLGPEIDGAFIDGFVRAQRRRDMQEVLARLVHDPALVSRQMVEDVLRYKRLDGAQTALERIAGVWFVEGRQEVDLRPALAVPTAPVQILWGREDRIVPVAQAEALMGRVPVHVIEGAGHLPHMEKPAEVNRLIAQFLAAHT